jgi:hypothetical protein
MPLPDGASSVQFDNALESSRIACFALYCSCPLKPPQPAKKLPGLLQACHVVSGQRCYILWCIRDPLKSSVYGTDTDGFQWCETSAKNSEKSVNEGRYDRLLADDDQSAKHCQYQHDWQQPEFLALAQETPKIFKKFKH